MTYYSTCRMWRPDAERLPGEVMLASIGTLAMVALLALVLSNRVSPLVALIVVPIAAACLAGLASTMPALAVAGISRIAPVAGMFVFAIIFFGLMTELGLLAPL